jgi:hypothetical protein
MSLHRTSSNCSDSAAPLCWLRSYPFSNALCHWLESSTRRNSNFPNSFLAFYKPAHDWTLTEDAALIVLYITGMVDTFPIRVWKPKHQCLQRTLFTNKVQIGVTFLGHIVLSTGPHLPLYDGHIWVFTKALHSLEPWEWWLGGMLLPHTQQYRTVLLM